MWRSVCSSADRRCSNYIWMINKIIACHCALILEVWHLLHCKIGKLYISSRSRRYHYHEPTLLHVDLTFLITSRISLFFGVGVILMIHDDMTTKKITVPTICQHDMMQQPMVQLLTNFGLYNLNIRCREAVHIFPWLWNGRYFCMNLSQFEIFF